MCSTSEHIRLKRDSQWPRLPLVGVQDFGHLKAELRNCPACLSTLAKQIEEEEQR